MRVVEINLERGWRGGERQTLWTAEGLRDRGVEVVVLARAGEALARACQAAGIAVVEVAGTGSAWRWLITRGRDADVWHAQTAHALTACALARRFVKVRLVATRRVALPPRGRLTRLKYRQADALVAISQAAAAPFHTWGLGPVAVIRSAVRPMVADPDAVGRLRARHVPRGWRAMGTVAAFTAEKDPLTLVAAVAALVHRHRDVVVHHLGDGPMRPQVEAAIERAGLQKHYRLLGFQEDMAPWFDLWDGYVASSRSEGLGSSVLDAMLHEVPVVATAAGGLVEALADDRGLLVPPGNVHALAVGLERLLSRVEEGGPQHLDRLARAHEWVQTECSVETMTARYLAIFQRRREAASAASS